MFSRINSLLKIRLCFELKAFLSSDAFKTATEAAKKFSSEPSNENKLKLYALYKQATLGKNTSENALDVAGKYKWEAWSALGDMSRDEAERNYISLVEKLAASRKDEDNSIEGLTVTFSEDGVLMFRLNNPSRKNPLTLEIYQAITNKLRNAADDPTCRVAVITGTGDYYSSGNDLNNFKKMMNFVSSVSMVDGGAGVSLGTGAELGRVILSDFQEALIEFPKPLIALVNGPAVGIMVTTLCLCDAVLASENATFSTPFSKLAQTPEGCSTLTFPLTMGPLIANDVLLFGRVLTAKEAAQYGLVSRVLPADSFLIESSDFVKHVASLPPNWFQASKRLIRGSNGQPLSRDTLMSISREECKILAKQWQSEECATAIAKFLSRRKK